MKPVVNQLVLIAVFLCLVGLQAEATESYLSDATRSRRTLARFTKGTEENKRCWDREGDDGFTSVFDIHNHFQPFGGPGVDFHTYVEWMHEHGILFSVMMGLGQVIVKTNAEDPECCYYLHCPTFNYTVTPSTENDIKNFDSYTTKYLTNQTYLDSVNLVASATFPNLQVPGDIISTLDSLESTYPDTIKWFGEINIVKNALSANGFWNWPRVTEGSITTENGDLWNFLKRVSDTDRPITFHCDLGCDNYDAVPGWEDKCVLSDEDRTKAISEYQWYKDFLGVHYQNFFNTTTNEPKSNFVKIQYLKLFDTVMTTFPDLKVVWAHMGLSKELKNLHPVVHADILGLLFDKHPNLHADISWDIISQMFLLNWDPNTDTLSKLEAEFHEDLHEESSRYNATQINLERDQLHARWEEHADFVNEWGSSSKLTGPTYHMVIYVEMFHKYPTRFLSGTDFVASMGSAEDYPGLAKYKSPATGCVKDSANHARQLTDTSAVNMFFKDEALSDIVLGGNFFRLTNRADVFAPPPVCAEDPTDSSDSDDISAALRPHGLHSILLFWVLACAVMVM